MSTLEYRIATIADFLAVPADKQVECLRDFDTWLRLAREAAGVNEIVSGLLGGAVAFSTEYFTWADDGVSGLSSLDLKDEGSDRVTRLDLHRTPP